MGDNHEMGVFSVLLALCEVKPPVGFVLLDARLHGKWTNSGVACDKWLPAWWALWLPWWPPAECCNVSMLCAFLVFTKCFPFLYHCCILSEIKLTTTTITTITTITTTTITTTTSTAAAATITTTTTTILTNLLQLIHPQLCRNSSLYTFHRNNPTSKALDNTLNIAFIKRV